MAQTYTNIEFIVVDDGSKDDSIAVFEEVLHNCFPHLEDRVSVYAKENGGLPSARQFGIERAHGDYILFLDPDDYVERDMVEKLVASAEANDSDIAYCDYWYEKPAKHRVKHIRELDYGNGEAARWTADILAWDACSYLWRCLIRTELYRQVKPEVPQYPMCEDSFTLCQLLEFAQRISHVREPLYHYLVREGSIANSKERYVRTRMGLVRNFLRLIQLFDERGYTSLSEKSRQDIRAYAAWSVFKYDRGNFTDYPGLQDFCRGFRPSQKIDGIAYYKQLLLKVYSTCISSPSCR